MKGVTIEKQKLKWTRPRKENLLKVINEYNKAVEKWKPILKEAAPQKESYINYRRNISTWNEYQSALAHLKKFTKYKKPPKTITTKTGLKITKWQADYFNKILERANKRRKEKVDYLQSKDIYVNGERIEGAKRTGLKNEYRQRKKNLDNIKSTKDFFDYQKRVEKELYSKTDERKTKILKDNLITSLNTVYGSYSDNINFIINKLPLSAINEIYENNQDEFTPSFLYDISVDYDSKIEELGQSVINTGYTNYLINLISDKSKKDKRKIKKILNKMDKNVFIENFKNIYNNPTIDNINSLL